MVGLLLRRVPAALVQLVATSFIVFALLYRAPGSPIQLLNGAQRLSPAAKEALVRKYHLDEPFLAQYGRWLVGAIRGDFGESITAHQSVAAVVGPRIVPTVELAAFAFVLVLVFGLGLGVLAAIRRGGVVDAVASALTLAGSAVSPYLSGLLLLAGLAVGLGWFPLFGSGTGGVDRLYHLVLPAVALAISLTALVARTCRASLAEVLDQEFVEVARSRGFTERRVVGRHALKNALIPVLTISGMTFGFLISGTVFVENTFGIGGLGSLLVSSVQNKDYAVAQAIVLILVAAFIVLSLVVDVLYAVVDPRVRSARTGS